MSRFDTLKSWVTKAASGPGITGLLSNIWYSSDKTKIQHGENVWSTGAGNREVMSLVEGANIDLLWDLIKQSPEFTSVIRVLIHDLLADGYDYVGSVSAKKRVAKFDKVSEFNCKLGDALWDLLVTGDAFILQLAVEQNEIAEFIDVELSARGIDGVKKFALKDAILREHITGLPKDLQVLPSSSMAVDADEFGNINAWVQTGKSGNQVVFSPKDVVHLSLNNIGGNTYGFTPAHTLIKDLLTLILAKDYASKVFENDGVPLGMFNLPQANPDNDRDLKFIKDQLKLLNSRANKLRTFITTGEVKFESLKSLAQDLEFRRLIEHFTSLVLLAWGVPAHRIPLMVENVKLNPTEANEGYFKSIDFMQKRLAAQLNKQLFNQFKVEISFNKSYRIDELRLATIGTMAADRNLATVSEIREKWFGLPAKMPPGLLPINLKGGVRTSFDEKRDDRESRGDESDTMPAPEDNQNNQLKYLNKEIEVFLDE